MGALLGCAQACGCLGVAGGAVWAPARKIRVLLTAFYTDSGFLHRFCLVNPSPAVQGTGHSLRTVEDCTVPCGVPGDGHVQAF